MLNFNSLTFATTVMLLAVTSCSGRPIPPADVMAGQPIPMANSTTPLAASTTTLALHHHATAVRSISTLVPLPLPTPHHHNHTTPSSSSSPSSSIPSSSSASSFPTQVKSSTSVQAPVVTQAQEKKVGKKFGTFGYLPLPPPRIKVFVTSIEAKTPSSTPVHSSSSSSHVTSSSPTHVQSSASLRAPVVTPQVKAVVSPPATTLSSVPTPPPATTTTYLTDAQYQTPHWQKIAKAFGELPFPRWW